MDPTPLMYWATLTVSMPSSFVAPAFIACWANALVPCCMHKIDLYQSPSILV